MKILFYSLFLGSVLSSITAFAQIAVQVPPEQIYKAARVLFPQKNPEIYWFCGVLTCSQISREINSKMTEISTCEVDIYGKKATLEYSDDIVDVLQTFKPRANKTNWTLTTYFDAISTYEAAPPHKVIWEEEVLARLDCDRIVCPCVKTPIDVER